MRPLASAVLAGCVATALSGFGPTVRTAHPSDDRPGADRSADISDVGPAVRTVHRVALPPPGATLDYQLGGGYQPAPGTRIATRDRTDRPAPGVYNICYVNGFQTQPQETGWWTAHAPDLLARDTHGRPVQDPGWPGEYLLDTTMSVKRSRLAVIVAAWIDGCARSGYRAVEADNLDSWTRSGGALGRGGNIAFARVLAARAHRDGLAFGQKNTPELATQGRSLGFDFAVAEECHAYGECGAYTDAYGQRVLDVEYTDNGGVGGFRRACAADHSRMSMVLRDRSLTMPGDPDYVHQVC